MEWLVVALGVVAAAGLALAMGVGQGAGRRAARPAAPRLPRPRAGQRGFAVDLPADLALGHPLSFQQDVDYEAFWRQTGRSPHLLLRVVILEGLVDARRRDPGAPAPGTPLDLHAITGFPFHLPLGGEPAARLARRCRACESAPAEVGVVPCGGPPRRAGRVTLACCPCGDGHGAWRAEGLEPTLVVALRAGPADGAVQTAVVVPAIPEDMAPPSAYVLRGGRLAGQACLLPGKLVFTNDVSLDPLDEVRAGDAPLPLDDDGLAQVEAALRRVGPDLARTLLALRRAPGPRTLWSLAGQPEPRLPVPERHDVAPTPVGEDGPGSTPDDPIPCHLPEGERAHLSLLCCPAGAPFRWRRTNSQAGTCPRPDGHAAPLSVRCREPGGIVVDRYELECGCGRHRRVLFFDMYHPA